MRRTSNDLTGPRPLMWGGLRKRSRLIQFSPLLLREVQGRLNTVADEFDQLRIHKIIFIRNVENHKPSPPQLVSKRPHQLSLMLWLHDENNLGPSDILGGKTPPRAGFETSRANIEFGGIGENLFRGGTPQLTSTANKQESHFGSARHRRSEENGSQGSLAQQSLRLHGEMIPGRSDPCLCVDDESSGAYQLCPHTSKRSRSIERAKTDRIHGPTERSAPMK
jgi:hypothetical protein